MKLQFAFALGALTSVCSITPAQADDVAEAEKIGARYGVEGDEVMLKVYTALDMCEKRFDRRPPRSAPLAFIERISRTKKQREMMPINDAFASYVLSKCPE